MLRNKFLIFYYFDNDENFLGPLKKRNRQISSIMYKASYLYFLKTLFHEFWKYHHSPNA